MCLPFYHTLEQEHIAYSEAINIMLEGKFEIVGRRLNLIS